MKIVCVQNGMSCLSENVINIFHSQGHGSTNKLLTILIDMVSVSDNSKYCEISDVPFIFVPPQLIRAFLDEISAAKVFFIVIYFICIFWLFCLFCFIWNKLEKIAFLQTNVFLSSNYIQYCFPNKILSLNVSQTILNLFNLN